MNKYQNNFILLSCIGILLFCSNALADKIPFVYDDHGQHDPFVPLVTPAGSVVTYDVDLNTGDLVLEGIVVDDLGKNAAIINGKVVAIHDTIGPYTIDAILVDQVNLSKGEEKFEIKLKKGGL